MKKRTIQIVGTIIIILFWICFLCTKIFSQSCPDLSQKSSQKTLSSFNTKYQGPGLEILYREFPATPTMKEWGSILSLRWNSGENIIFGFFAGGSVIQINDLVEDSRLDHLGRVTREGGFITLQNSPKKFFYFATSARVGHIWQLRPGDYPQTTKKRGFHSLESSIQLDLGFRAVGKGSVVIPSLQFGARHLVRGGPYEGPLIFYGFGIKVLGPPKLGKT